MRYSILELLALPLLCIFTIPVGSAALGYGLTWFPWFVENCLPIRDWFLNRGVSPDTAATYIPIFVLDLPGLALIAVLSLALFVLGTRLADSFAILMLLLYPLAALSVLHAVDARHLLAMLKTKALTIVTATVLTASYIILRRTWARPDLTPLRLALTLIILAAIFGSSGLLWLQLNA